MYHLFKPAIERQIAEFIDWRRSLGMTTSEAERLWLKKFANITKIHGVSDITEVHVASFRQHLAEVNATHYAETVALRTLRGFLRYYTAKGYPCPRDTVAKYA